MDQLRMGEGQRAVVRERWRKNETEYLRERRARVDVSSFVKLKTIGHGAFGVVSLVREKGTGQLYAMKQLRKTDMLRKGQEGHVRAERDVLKGAALVGNPNGAEWIVRLFYSFQDRDHLYLACSHLLGTRCRLTAVLGIGIHGWRRPAESPHPEGHLRRGLCSILHCRGLVSFLCELGRVLTGDCV